MFDQLDAFDQFVMKVSALVVSHTPQHVIPAEVLHGLLNEKKVRHLTEETVGIVLVGKYRKDGEFSLAKINLVLARLQASNFLRFASQRRGVSQAVGRGLTHRKYQALGTQKGHKNLLLVLDYEFQCHLLQVLIEAGIPDQHRKLLISKIQAQGKRTRSRDKAEEPPLDPDPLSLKPLRDKDHRLPLKPLRDKELRFPLKPLRPLSLCLKREHEDVGRLALSLAPLRNDPPE